MDINLHPMERGFVYLAVVLDWFSRRVLSWRSVDYDGAAFCVETAGDALARHGRPDIFNTDQGSQFPARPSRAFSPTTKLRSAMDGKGAWRRQRIRRAPMAQRQI